MADLDSLEQKVDLDCHFMEMFLGRASSPDIMGQDMSSNKQETLDRALDCFLQMTLGIIDIETLNTGNIQAVNIKAKKDKQVLLLSKYVDCRKTVMQNQSTVVSGTLAQASLQTQDSFNLEPGHIWNFKYLKYLDSLKLKFVQDSMTIGTLRNSVTDTTTQAMFLDKALDCSVKLVVSISTIEMLHVAKLKPDNLATIAANHTELMGTYNSCLKSLNQSTTISAMTQASLDNNDQTQGAEGPPTPAMVYHPVAPPFPSTAQGMADILDSTAVSGVAEYTDEAATTDITEKVSSVEYAGDWEIFCLERSLQPDGQISESSELNSYPVSGTQSCTWTPTPPSTA
jgi:hypothetical protein